MTKRVAFVEFKEEIVLLENNLDEDMVIVAMQPSVELELDRRSLKYKNTLQYFDKVAHSTVLEVSNSIINMVRPAFTELQQDVVKHAYERTSIFYLRFYLHYWLANLYIIHKVVAEVRPEYLVVLPHLSGGESGTPLRRYDSLLGEVILRYANHHNINIIKIGNHKQTKKSRKKYIKWFLPPIFYVSLWIYHLLYFKKNLLIATSDTYNMPEFLTQVGMRVNNSLPVYLSVTRKNIGSRLIDMIKGKSFSFVSLSARPPKKLQVLFDRQWNVCMDKIHMLCVKHKMLMSFKNVDISGALLNYLNKSIQIRMKDLNKQIWSIHKIFQHGRPAAVFSQHSVGEGYVLGEICREAQVPAMLISHGSHVPHSEKFAKIEWSEHARTLLLTHYPFVAAQTPWARLFVESYGQVVSKPIVTGPLLFAGKSILSENVEQLRKRVYNEHADKKILIHAGTPKSWRSFRPWVYETVGEYIHNINEIIKAVETVHNVYLAIRFRPTADLTIDEFKNLLVESDCYDIYTDGTFEEHLLAADMLVSYSSTTIEEALQNSIPVIQFDPDDKYWHIPCENKGGGDNIKPVAVSCASSRGELAGILSNFVSGNKKAKAEIDWEKHIYNRDDKFQWLREIGVNNLL